MLVVPQSQKLSQLPALVIKSGLEVVIEIVRGMMSGGFQSVSLILIFFFFIYIALIDVLKTLMDYKKVA